MIEWDGPNPSATSTATPTVPPSASGSLTAGPSPTASLTAGATPSTTATGTKSSFCLPSAFVAFPHTDLGGTWLGGGQLVSTVAQCQSFCCNTPGCDGYTIDNSMLAIASQTNCFALANITMLVPSSGYAAGVRAGLL